MGWKQPRFTMAETNAKATLLAIKYRRGHLEILNQLLLPEESVYEEVKDTEDGWKAIREMKVGN